MIRNAGAREVHMRISCPPTISSCYYGVDTPSKKHLIAANKTVEEIRDFIGADSLAYLSIDGLKKACAEGVNGITYCTACYTGKYPTNFVDVDEIETAQSNAKG
jgi:amidophosphoribosyltransferase